MGGEDIGDAHAIRAWAHDDGERVISAHRMVIAQREGGASVMAVAGYRTALVAAAVPEPIDTAPKAIQSSDGIHRYGRRILVFAGGEWCRARWWETKDNSASNFIADGGMVIYPSHWKELPPAPVRPEERG